MEYEAVRLCPPGIGMHYNVKNILQPRELISIHILESSKMHTFITLRRILIHRMIPDFSEVPY
jgi:hypothetical protein